MSRFFSSKYSGLVPYTPGEQPQDQQYIKLNTNESPFPPSPMAQRMARQAAGDLQLYSDPECRELTAIGAAYFGVDREEILFTNGSDEGLNFAFMAFCDEKHPAVFPDITYGFYPVFARLNGVPYEEIPLGEDFTVNPSEYMGVGKTVFLANPNAPTGIAIPVSEIEKILISNPDNVVVIDEAYVDFGAESCVNLIHTYSNLLVIQTMSKSRNLAGGRLGFCIGCRELIRDLNTIKYSVNPYNVNRMTMAAGIGAFADREYFRFCCEEIAENRSRSAEELKKIGFLMTDSLANFLFVRHPKIGGRELSLKLKEKGILIRHFETPRLKDYNRITVGSAEQMKTLAETLTELLKEYT